MKCKKYALQECDDLCINHGCRVIWRSHTVDDETLRLFIRKTENNENWWMFA